MRATIGIVYWLVVGLLILFALYVSVAGNGISFWLVVPVILSIFGAWWPGLGYSGAALIVFGAYPALLITRAVLLQIYSSDWSCSTVAFDGISNPNGGVAVGGSAGCTTVSIDLISLMLVLWTVALLGAVLLYRQPRPSGA